MIGDLSSIYFVNITYKVIDNNNMQFNLADRPFLCEDTLGQNH